MASGNDHCGPPKESFALFASPLPIAIPAPPYGTVFLDLATLLHLSSGIIDSQGVGALTFLLPANPGTLSGARSTRRLSSAPQRRA